MKTVAFKAAVFFNQINSFMKSELTYIIGAGASFQSIPIVKTFSDRFDQFIMEVKTLTDDTSGASVPQRTPTYLKESTGDHLGLSILPDCVRI